MGNKKTTAAKKTKQTTNKQVVSKKKTAKKASEKKSVKKIIRTGVKSDKKTKKTVEKEPVIESVSSKTTTTPVEEIKLPQQEVKKETVTPPPPPPPKNHIGILPVEDDEDEKLKPKASEVMNTQNANVDKNATVTQQPAQKVYTFKKGIELMEGHLKINIDDTNVSRRNDVIFDVYGKNEHGAEFRSEFECHDKEEGDFLSSQLADCEANPSKYMTAVADTNTTTTPQNETQQQNQQQQQNTQQNLSGVPLNSVNIDDLINSLPPKVEQQNINPVNQNPINPNIPVTPSTASATDISNILKNQSNSQLESYGKSIQDHIDNSFQANVWGGMPQNDVRLFLKNCDSQYIYELLQDAGRGFYIKIKKDAAETRIPKNPNEYLKIK